MNREGAETYLRLLAESELRRVTALPAESPAQDWHAPGVMLAAQALCAVGAIDDDTATQVRAEFDVALAVRQLSRAVLPPIHRHHLLMELRRTRTAFTALPAAVGEPAPAVVPAAQWRVVPVGRVIPGYGLRGNGDLLLLAYVQTPAGAWFTVGSGMPRSPGLAPGPGRPPQPQPALPSSRTMTDDQGHSYQFFLAGGTETCLLVLRTTPPRAIRWLELVTDPGAPANRIDLEPPGPPSPAPEMSVTRIATSPGEVLLDGIATRILISTAGFAPRSLGQRPAVSNDGRSFFSEKPGTVTAALYAAGALSPASPVPGQLAGLCERVGITGHGITAPPAADLPEPWQNMLTSFRPLARPALAHGSWACAMAGLPGQDGVRITILGLHQGKHGTIVHALVSGVTPDVDWSYASGPRSLPALWVHDSNGYWRATRTSGMIWLAEAGLSFLWLQIVPSLEADTRWIDIVVAGPSAKVTARLPLRWQAVG